ncbi:hypothetical protein ACL1C3_02215, partial [Corynebacterium striatum]
RKITTTPNPTGQKKGAVKPQKMIHAISMHTKQINLIIYNRAPKKARSGTHHTNQTHSLVSTITITTK